MKVFRLFFNAYILFRAQHMYYVRQINSQAKNFLFRPTDQIQSIVFTFSDVIQKGTKLILIAKKKRNKGVQMSHLIQKKVIKFSKKYSTCYQIRSFFHCISSFNHFHSTPSPFPAAAQIFGFVLRFHEALMQAAHRTSITYKELVS